MNSPELDQDRMQFFSTSLLTKAVSCPDAMRGLKQLHDRCSDKSERDGLLLGYKLMLETLLFKELGLIITRPGILHFPFDKDLRYWWVGSEAKSSLTFRFSTDAETSYGVFVANRINDLILQVVRTGVSWDRLMECTATVLSFAQSVLSIGRDSRLVHQGGVISEQNQEIDLAMRWCAAELLHDLIYDYRDFTRRDAYEYANPNRTEWVDGSLLEDFGMMRIDTSRDHIGIKPVRRGGSPGLMGLGINATAQLAMESLTNQRLSSLKLDVNILPKEEIFGDMLEEFEAGRWPSRKYSLRFPAEPPKQELEGIILFDISPPHPEEYLQTLLGNDAHLASGRGVDAERYFQALLLGLCMTQDASNPVQVLQINHVEQPENPHPPVSLAVQIANEWHVFYGIDAVGRMKSPVWPLLRSLEGQVEVKLIQGIPAGFLLSLCDRAFRYVSHKLEVQKDLNSHLRGTIPELLAALFLVYDGCHPTRCSLKIEDIGDLDAVGYSGSLNGGQLRVVEVKKQSTTQTELESEIQYFADKLDKIREALSKVQQAIRCPGPIEEVSGLFISMAVIDEFDADEGPPESEPSGRFFDSREAEREFRVFLGRLGHIEFWDYNRFQSKLRNAGLPPLPIRLLEEIDFIWELAQPDLEGYIDAGGNFVDATIDNV